ncbi:MAG TPA: DegT/DnrJ/EryC1/StrS family aminotransferase [Candidatus Acidoferrales bacterium]|nr:DegT/DnrJ/EryC1/StrS family aminotransferase [Candidatus Acidoferrales bacterium]
MSSTQFGASIELANARTVSFLNFETRWLEERAELEPIIARIFASGQFIGGDDVDRFEAEVAAYLRVRHAITLNSGTDALIFALRVLDIGPGDEVITASNSFVASAAAIAHVGATPVFADVLDDQTIDPDAVAAAITPRTKAIMPVHLTGRVADMDAIAKLASRAGIAIVEDAAQAFGSKDGERFAGTFGVGAFSGHPLKNLGAAGDAGFITTDEAAIAARLRRMRNHGLRDRDTSLEFGYVSRLDTLQAAVLRYRLSKVDGVVARRRANAAQYDSLLARTPVFVPAIRVGSTHTYHLYVIQAPKRDQLRSTLAERGIATKVHYPVPIHLQPAAEYLGYRRGSLPRTEAQGDRILSIPIHESLSPDDIRYVAGAIEAFYR